MPSVRISTGEWASEKAGALASAAREAVACALDLRADEQDVSFHTTSVPQMSRSGSQSVRFARVEVFMWQGRDQTTKARLYQEIARSFGRLGVTQVKILCIELARENVFVSAPA